MHSAFELAGVALFAISYDAVPVLRSFADRHDVTFPLLSDEGSVVIRRLGLLNEHVAAQQAYYGLPVEPRHAGLPYPGYFVLTPSGLVERRAFEQSYRIRPAGTELAVDVGGHSPGVVRSEARSHGVVVAAELSTDRYRPYQLLRIHTTVSSAEDTHVYLPPTPRGYVPLEIAIEGPGPLEAWPAELPEGRPVHLEVLGETFQVNDGAVRLALPFIIKKQLGDVTVRLRVSYQACTGSVCHPPVEHVLEFRLRGNELIGMPPATGGSPGAPETGQPGDHREPREQADDR